jgi:hypothetical protein
LSQTLKMKTRKRICRKVRNKLKRSRTASLIEGDMDLTREAYLSVFGGEDYKPVPDAYSRTFQGNFFPKELFVKSDLISILLR